MHSKVLGALLIFSHKWPLFWANGLGNIKHILSTLFRVKKFPAITIVFVVGLMGFCCSIWIQNIIQLRDKVIMTFRQRQWKSCVVAYGILSHTFAVRMDDGSSEVLD